MHFNSGTPEPATCKHLAKEQHYVPQFYLKHFADQGGKLSVLNIPKDAIHADVPYRSQCHKTYYYGEDGRWETRLSSMESGWSTAIDRLINREPITADDADLVRQFALYQRQRTLAQTEFINRQDAIVLADVVQMRLRNQPHSQQLFTDVELARACREKIERETVPGFGIDLLKGMESVIDDLNLAVIRYDTVNELLASDVPTIAINKFCEHSIGFGCMGLILFFPLTPHDLVVIYDGGMYSAYRDRSYVTSQDEREVEDLNRFQYISAETIVLAQKQETLTGLDYTNPEIKQERGHSRDAEAVSVFGSSNNHVIAVHSRITYHECNLSFAQLVGRARKIPFQCREAVPRVKEKGWAEKLSRKGSILAPPPQMAVTSSEQERSRSDRENLRRGCQSMSRFAEVYWNKRNTV
jgi:hypothetical protein